MRIWTATARRTLNFRHTRSWSPVIWATIFVFLFSPLLSLSVSARTLAEYQTGIESASALVEELRQYAEELETGTEDAAYEGELIEAISAEIPAAERVESPGVSVETENSWLGGQLAAFQKETDSAKRVVLLNGLSERLLALRGKIAELENASAASRSKDEDKQKLAEILRREEFQKPAEKQPSLIEKWYRQFLEWIQSLFPRPNISPQTGSGFQSLSFVLQILLYALVLGAIAFLIYKFAPLFAGKWSAREKRERAERVILGERIAADESAEDLFGEAETLARAGNLRGAIRKGYIALLCELSDRKIIGLAQHKTNRDYLRDVRGRGELYESMNGLTGSFERHWYGFQTADESDWQEFRRDYQKTIGKP